MRKKAISKKFQKVLMQIEEFKKDPQFVKDVKSFIKFHTS